MGLIAKRSHELAGRLKEIRVERFGLLGGETIAVELNLPTQTWKNYEAGVVIPGTHLLQFIARTGANPHWLLTGDGERYVAPMPQSMDIG